MKNIQFIVMNLAFTLIFSVLVVAQTEKTQPSIINKVAIIDDDVLRDKKLGIKQLVRFESYLENESMHAYQSENVISRKIETLEKEIYCLESQNKPFQDKATELEKLKDERKRIKANVEAYYERRRSELVIPVFEKIREKLKEFVKQKGYEVVINKSLIIKESVLIEGNIDDITTEFINFCNDLFDKEVSK